MAHHTIYDIARLAGVSGKTVSRVLNQEPGVSPLTRARITKLIDQLGYQPHSGARSMRGQRRDCVGVVFTAPPEVVPISNQQIQWMFEELYRIFGMRGKFICFDLNPFESPDGSDYARALWQQRCSGCVIHGPLPIHDQTVHRIHQSGSPYMAMNRLDSLPEICFASPDYEEAAYLSTKFLIDRGHTRIGMLKGWEGYQAGVERWRGYVRALEEAGLPLDEALVRAVTFDAHDIAAATHRLLLDFSTTAIVDCSSTEKAAPLVEGARFAGRAPGKDFEVVVWTYAAQATVLKEACAHVWLPLREAAAEGLALLVQWFDKEREEPFQVLYRPTLYETAPDAALPTPTPIFNTLR
ncbi:MAG: LacI family DNA-binding transcriptional regulator [Candidatus Hydrogenedentes bacterium]|nr:LacI family DNA-binding transcriptional regulator [Candidatus Hydrogenedentota bacterium]MBI3119071.1 LacI family DNA-binding transcriptional regulator [Candidatus Hydrogenedentota bacterium]